MSNFNNSIGTPLGAPFLVGVNMPIDNRIVVENAAGRAEIPLYAQYEGLICYQKDTNTIHVLTQTGVGAAGQAWSILTTANNAETFPFTGSAIMSGSLSVIGPTVVTAPTSSTSDHLFLVRSTDSADNKFVINLEGVTVLGAFNETPTPVEGGMFYSASGEFYLGS